MYAGQNNGAFEYRNLSVIIEEETKETEERAKGKRNEVIIQAEIFFVVRQL